MTATATAATVAMSQVVGTEHRDRQECSNHLSIYRTSLFPSLSVLHRLRYYHHRLHHLPLIINIRPQLSPPSSRTIIAPRPHARLLSQATSARQIVPLMGPYLAWIGFATVLTATIDKLNPDVSSRTLR